MHAEQFAERQRPEDGGVRHPLLSQFLGAIASLEKSWATDTRHVSYFPLITWTPEGPRLGAATLLMRKRAGEEARLLALLSVAHGFVVPSSVLKHLAWAELEFQRRNLAKSAMHVALTGLPALSGIEAARRLHMAAGILDRGFL